MQGPLRRAARRIAIGAAFLAICLVVGLTGPGNPPQLRADETPGWTLAELSGEVRVQLAGSIAWVPGATGALLPIGSSLRTGEAGTATLTMGGDRIQVMPSSEVTLPEPDPSSGILTSILQRAGTLFFKVAHRPSGTFRVDTPYLAVVVKGTEFGVSVSGEGASVSVSQGTVSVSRSEGGPAASVSAGQKATTTSEPDAAVSVSTGSSSAAPAAPSTATTATTETTAATAAAISSDVDSGTTDGAASGDTAGSSSSSGGDSASGDSSSGDSSGSTSGSLGSTAGSLGDAVGGALGGLGDAVGGALGGLGHRGN